MEPTKILSFLLGVALVPSLASAQGSEFSVQGASLQAPERGSVAGSHVDSSFSAGSVSRGSFSLSLPIGAPTERGSSLVGFAPSYAPEHGLSEWGMGWKSSLEIVREPVFGALDYGVDEFVSPWGRLVEGDDGRWYIDGLSSAMVLERSSESWLARGPNGVVYRFSPGHRGPSGAIYSWELVEATDLFGGRTVLTYAEMAQGQRVLSTVQYGSPSEPLAYTVELVPEPVSTPTTSYRTGVGVTLTHRIKTVVMRRGSTERWRYELTYRDNYYSPAFYLEQIQRTLAAGGVEPAIEYGYLKADETLSSLRAEELPEATAYTQSVRDVAAFSAERGTFIDINRDGLLDFERVTDYAMMVRTSDGWVAEALPPRSGSGYWSQACRPSGSSATPRRLVRLDGWEDVVRVVTTVSVGARRGSDGTLIPAHTKFALCERDGELLWIQDLARDWELGVTTLLADVDEDDAPDLLRLRTGGFDILVNGGGDRPFNDAYSGALKVGTRGVSGMERAWFDDLNGDGVGDILATDGSVIYAWYGLGGYEYVEQAHEISLYRWASNRWYLDTVDEASVSFVDVNRDGLKDILVTDDVEVRLYPNGGTYFVARSTSAFDFGLSRGWSMEEPLLADLSGDGNDELVFAGYNVGVPDVRGMQLSPPGTGLLSRVNDGKGSEVEFLYDRGPASEGVGVRPIVLSSVRTRTVGLDATAYSTGADDTGERFGQLVYDYDYDGPVIHTENHQLRGYESTKRLGPHLVEVVHMRHDDHVANVVLSEYKFPRGRAWESDQDLRLYNYARNEWEDTSYQGVPWTRSRGKTSGWGQVRWSETPPAEREYLWAPPTTDEVQEFGVSNEILEYEGLCATKARTSNSRGVTTAVTELSHPSALAGTLHCTAAKESVLGEHPDPRDDFQLMQRVVRNRFGQVTDVFQGSASREFHLQNVEYDSLGRVVAISAPGQDGLVTSHFAYDGSLPTSITRPDGVTVAVDSYDDLTDQMRALSTDRGDGAVYTASFSFDDFERLWRSWDNAGQSSPEDPLDELRYFFATDDALGRIEADSTVSQADSDAGTSAIKRRGVSWMSGDGQAVASGALIPEGWMVSGLNARSRNELWQRSYIRSPLVGTPGNVNYDELFEGGVELAYGQLDGLGEQVRSRQVLASDRTEGDVRAGDDTAAPTLTEKTLSIRQVWTPQGMQRITIENGTYVHVVQTDHSGAVLWTRDPGGEQTTIQSDTAGRIRGVTLADGTEQYLSYDDLGRPHKVTRPDVGEVEYFYAADTGWLYKKEMRDSEGVLYWSSEVEYDSLGRAKTTTDRAPGTAPFVVESFYDGTGPKGSAVLEGQRGLLSRVRTAKHLSESYTNPDGTIAWSKTTVADFIEVYSETEYYADKSPKATTRTVRNLKTKTVIDSSESEYKYDAYGRLDTVHLNGTVLVAVDYDEEGRVKYVSLPTGEMVEYHHDSVTKAINGYTQHTGSLWNLSVNWKLNRRGFIEREVYSFGREENGTSQYNGREIDRGYEYNPRGFLVRTTDNAVETGYYEYDASGLSTFVRDEEGSRALGRPRDRVIQFDEDSPRYVYDAAGRLIQKGATEFFYGAHGDIAEANTPDGLFRYYYDEAGQRILKTRVVGDSEIPHVVYLGGAFITADKIVEPIHVAGQLIGVLENSQFHMLPTDPRGTSLGDLDGTVKMPSAYGVRAERPDLSEALDYTEKGYDPDLDLVRMGVRDYDPLLGQFTRPDPLFVEAIDKCAESPVECNLWGYAKANPVMFTDPTGLQSRPEGAEEAAPAAPAAAPGSASGPDPATDPNAPISAAESARIADAVLEIQAEANAVASGDPYAVDVHYDLSLNPDGKTPEDPRVTYHYRDNNKCNVLTGDGLRRGFVNPPVREVRGRPGRYRNAGSYPFSGFRIVPREQMRRGDLLSRYGGRERNASHIEAITSVTRDASGNAIDGESTGAHHDGVGTSGNYVEDVFEGTPAPRAPGRPAGGYVHPDWGADNVFYILRPTRGMLRAPAPAPSAMPAVSPAATGASGAASSPPSGPGGATR